MSSSNTLFLHGTGSVSEPGGATFSARLATSPRDLLISVSPVLGLQVCVLTRGSKLRSIVHETTSLALRSRSSSIYLFVCDTVSCSQG